jgi:ATP-dependent DNA helicase RecG
VKRAARQGLKRATDPSEKNPVSSGGAAKNASPAPPPHPSLAFATPAIRDKLVQLGITTLEGLLLHLPLRYEDETRIVSIHDAMSGDTVQIEATVIETEVKYRPRRQLVTRVGDGSGEVSLRFFNFYPSQQAALAPGVKVRVIGEIRQGFFGGEMVHPRFRVIRAQTPLPQALTPIYPTTAGLPQANLRKMALRALDSADLSDTLPEPVLRKLHLPKFADALRTLHCPPPDADAAALEARSHPAWQRIKFDELLAQQLSMRMHYEQRHRESAHALMQYSKLSRALLASLPFELTAAQHRVLAEIRADLAKPHPMRRLLQGDVGSGKTIVAALAALQAIESGYQVVVMAPTEILAEQHFLKFSTWLTRLGVDTLWFAGSQTKKERDKALAAAASKVACMIVGTHALFQQDVAFGKLGLAIVDEQHRFGVQQRLALRTKGAESAKSIQPHQLMMSATPIPRTLAMSYYADLDVSVLDELPPGRSPVATRLLSESRRDEVIQRLKKHCEAGKQAYWVCPLIEESEEATSAPAAKRVPLKGRERREALQLQNALDTYQRLKEAIPEVKVGLVHGRLPNQEKAATMAAFQANSIQLLVATTVIEVGVDVPNASLMVIEHAERMGLSQLHQLRGRVGRGPQHSDCILLYQPPLSDNARERLRIIFENNDGFVIARYDLKLRGPGELLGARQSGVPMLKFADLEQDLALLESARGLAAQLLRDHPAEARRHLARWHGSRQEFLQV